jgi:uncharacterized protein
MSAHQALIARGQVRHTRLRPAHNHFVYDTYFLMLPMRSLQTQACPALKRGRFGGMSFFDQDHGDGRANSLQWLDEVLAQAHVHDAQGEVWLQCYPRVLGHTFKPVSFWYCHRADNSLSAIVVEVNNTFGERHCYLLSGPQVAFGRELRMRKILYVSPFCSTTGQYRFRFMRNDLKHNGCTNPSIVACIEHDDEQGLVLRTSISGRLERLTPHSVRRAFWGAPFMTLVVVARIHWQALKLWCKRVPLRSKPPAPASGVSYKIKRSFLP